MRKSVTRTDANKHATVLKELSAALSQAAELLEETAPLESEAAHRIEHGIDFYREVTQFEIRLIRSALRLTKGNQKNAAQLLGIGNTTLNAMIKRHRIDRKFTY
jgi:DNA-binding NtrC family response regulator